MTTRTSVIDTTATVGQPYQGALAVHYGEDYWTLTRDGIELLLPAETATDWGDLDGPIEFAMLAGDYRMRLLFQIGGAEWAGGGWQRFRLHEPFASAAGLPCTEPDGGMKVTIVVARPGDRTVLATRTVTWPAEFADAVRTAVARQPERSGGGREFWSAVTAEADEWDDLHPDHASMATADGAVRTTCAARLTLFDADMNPIGTPTADQIEAATTADGGWIWINTDGEPVAVIDEKRDEDTGAWVPLAARGGYRDDLAKVCVA